VINPLENFDENKILEMENLVHKYYDLVRATNIENTEKLDEFQDFDLEGYLTENGNLEIDLKDKLKID
jgi:hypothetical protein